MTACIQIATATATREDAERIADSLTRKKLAACVQIVGPISSVYRWQGRIEKATEWLCLIKTERSLYEEAAAAIRELHPYQVPEVLAFEAVAGSSDYLKWLSDELGPAETLDR